MQRQAWPIVNECHGHPFLKGGTMQSCAQCDGSHQHEWAEGETVYAGDVTNAVRCIHCGARKCDRPLCTSRRHHRDPHILSDGTVVPVGV